MARRIRTLSVGLTAVVLLGSGAESVHAQASRGSTGHTLAGAGLGVYSGATLGLLGSMYPCSRSHLGRRCTLSVASAGAAIGLAMGGIIGFQDRFALDRRFEAAGWGAAAGAATGLFASQLVDRYGYMDVVTLAWVGGALGAGEEGAYYGAGIGVGLGLLAWSVLPERGVQDAVVIALAGLALGGLYDFVDGAATKPPATPFGASFSIPF